MPVKEIVGVAMLLAPQLDLCCSSVSTLQSKIYA